jgi:hypothetical protein
LAASSSIDGYTIASSYFNNGGLKITGSV